MERKLVASEEVDQGRAVYTLWVNSRKSDAHDLKTIGQDGKEAEQQWIVGTLGDMSPHNDSEFALATRLSRLADSEYRVELGSGWEVAGAVNGGYLLAVLAKALRETSPGTTDPLVISTYYLGPSTAGPATVSVRSIREGKSTSTFAVDLIQGESSTITALATMGTLSSLPGDVATTATEPEVPGPDQCIKVAEASPNFVAVAPLISRYDMRLDPATSGFAVGEPSGRGLLQGWIRLADGAEPDPLALLAFVDAFPPVMFDLGRFGWSPTVELTAHVRAIPAPGWIKVKVSTSNIAGGMFEEDCELWDSTGRLVAQSRQLAKQPRD